MDNYQFDDKWCRRRYVVLLNRVENKVSIMDSFEKRYQYLREKVSEFSHVIELLRKDIPCRLVMITLTIARVEDYNPGMMRDYMKKLKQHLGEKLYAFAWVAEMQERGAVHYHLLVCVEKGTRIVAPDKSGMWKWGSSRTETARTAFYICTYIGKERQKDLSRFPKHCRTFAVSYRLPEGRARAFYESERKIKIEKNKQKDLLKSMDWEYKASTVTLGYAETFVEN